MQPYSWLPTRPRFIRSVKAAVPATAGVLIQFPFYAGIFWHDHQILDLARDGPVLCPDFYARTYAVLIAVYSAVLGLFVPSAGSKWLIEAPYLLQAATQLHVNLGWVVQIYNTAEALANLINPFWTLPVLGLLRLPARQLIGDTALQLIVKLPLVLLILAPGANSTL
jgi:short-chain fatty acids transporter